MDSRARTRGSTLSLVGTVVLLVVCATTLTTAVAIATNHLRVVTVLTGSMAPGIPVGSLVVATPLAPDAVQVGQVIVFKPPTGFTTPGDRPVVHRVAGVATVAGVREIRTKGDMNAAVDPWILDADRTTLFTEAVTSPAGGRIAGALGDFGIPALVGLALLWAARRVLRRIWTPRPSRPAAT